MSPPQPIDCSDESCSYSTPANIPTYELIIKTLELHVKTVHQIQSSSEPSHTKTEKPKRPVITTGLSESEWSFFTSKWTRYVRQTRVSGQQLLDELWTCMDTELEKLAFADNLTATDQESLLQRIKSLAVTTLHPSIHVVNLHQMRQNNEETTKAFSARVRSVAANCNLEKKCTGSACTEIVSYIEETCYHVVMAGLHDQDMKDRALTQAMLGAIKDLPTLVNFATAEESARKTATKSEISAMNKAKQPPNKRKCSHCGQAQHGEFNKNRISQCKAQGSKCAKCQRLHHYAAMCRSQRTTTEKRPTQTAAIQEENEDPEIGGFIAAICSSEISSVASAQPLVRQLRSASSKVNTIPVPHHTYSRKLRLWKRGPPKSSPVLSVSVKLDRRAYKELGLNQPALVKKMVLGLHVKDVQQRTLELSLR